MLATIKPSLSGSYHAQNFIKIQAHFQKKSQICPIICKLGRSIEPKNDENWGKKRQKFANLEKIGKFQQFCIKNPLNLPSKHGKISVLTFVYLIFHFYYFWFVL